MEYYSSQISQLVEQLASLPGIGAKTAQRLAFHIIDMPEERVEKLVDSIVKAKKTIRYCKECLTLTDKELCPICFCGQKIGLRIVCILHGLLAFLDQTRCFFIVPLFRFCNCLEKMRKGISSESDQLKCHHLCFFFIHVVTSPVVTINRSDHG